MKRGKPDPHAVRRIRALCDQAGVKCLAVMRSGSGHYQALVEAPDGRRVKATVGSTPSEYRNAANSVAWLRRFAENRRAA